jgi:hypothetical protein
MNTLALIEGPVIENEGPVMIDREPAEPNDSVH